MPPCRRHLSNAQARAHTRARLTRGLSDTLFPTAPSSAIAHAASEYVKMMHPALLAHVVSRPPLLNDFHLRAILATSSHDRILGIHNLDWFPL